MHSTESPYSQAELEEQLDDILCAALSSRRSAAAVAAGIAPLPRAQQEFVLAWAAVAAHNVAELGYQFTAQAPQALALFGRAGTEKWLLHALDAYDKQGLYPACAALKDLAGFKRRTDAAGEGVALAEVTRVLELFLRGLAALLAGLRAALPASLAAAQERLARADSSVADTVALLREFYALPLPDPFPYMGSLHPERSAQVRGERVAKERRALYSGLEQLRQSLRAETDDPAAGAPELDVDSSFETLEFELQIDGEAVAPPEQVARLMRSIIQDFGEIPEEYLLASGPGAYAGENLPEDEAAGALGESHAAGGQIV